MGALPGLDFRSARRRRRKRGSRGRVRGAPRSDQRRGPFPAPASDLYFFPAPSLGVGACRSGASRAGSALRRTVRSRRLSRGPSRRCPRSDRRRASALRSPATRADVVAQRASTGLPRRCLRSDPRYPSRRASYASPLPSPRSDRRRASALRPPLTLAEPNPRPARNPRRAARAGPGRVPRSARRYRFTARRTVDFVGLCAPFYGTLSRLRPLLTCTFFQLPLWESDRAAPGHPRRAPRSARRYNSTARRTVDSVGPCAPIHGTSSRLRPLLTCTFFPPNSSLPRQWITVSKVTPSFRSESTRTHLPPSDSASKRELSSHHP